MRIMRLLTIAACTIASWAACAEPIKITNIGHGYFAAALYVAKQEKIFEKYAINVKHVVIRGGTNVNLAALGTDEAAMKVAIGNTFEP